VAPLGLGHGRRGWEGREYLVANLFPPASQLAVDDKVKLW